MSILLFVIVAVLLFVLWDKVLRLEKEIGTIRNYLSSLQNCTPTTDEKNNNQVPSNRSTYGREAAGLKTSEPNPVIYPDPVMYAAQVKDNSISKTESKHKTITLENWLGRNVLGIAASVLVFVGLIFLGTLVYGRINDTVKVIAMYTISALVTIAGIVLTVKKRNNFTVILTGCGCGSFFISILLTHIYFNRISDIAAFSLLLVWMTLILYLSKVLDSTLLSIVAHIGMIVSICFAYGRGLSDDKLVIVMIYQFAAVAVIILGNTLCCKRTYHFGVFVSLFLTVIGSFFMWERFISMAYPGSAFPFASSLPTAGIAVAFAVQFLCVSFLSYLLSVSTGKLKNDSLKMTVHVMNKFLWLAALLMNVYNVAYRITAGMYVKSEFELSKYYIFLSILVAALICFVILIAHAAITLMLSLKLNFNKKLETFSVLFLSGVATILLIILWCSQFAANIHFAKIPYLILLSLLLLLSKRISRNKMYAVGANVVLAIDFILMLFAGYRSLTNYGTIFLSVIYMLIYIVILWAQWFMQNEETKEKYSTALRLTSYLGAEISIVAILIDTQMKYKMPILLLILTILNIVLYLFRYDKNTENDSLMRISMLINEFVLLSFDAGFIAYSHKDATSTILYFILSALALGLSFIRISELLDGRNNNFLGIAAGIKLTVLVIATVYGQTSWFDQTYIFSIVCMLTSLICIVLGYVWNIKSLRLYGLVLTLVCVLKLVTYDVTNLNTLLRVIALIGGGVICFIISAIYNYTSKKLGQDKANLAAEEK